MTRIKHLGITALGLVTIISIQVTEARTQKPTRMHAQQARQAFEANHRPQAQVTQPAPTTGTRFEPMDPRSVVITTPANGRQVTSHEVNGYTVKTFKDELGAPYIMGCYQNGKQVAITKGIYDQLIGAAQKDLKDALLDNFLK